MVSEMGFQTKATLICASPQKNQDVVVICAYIISRRAQHHLVLKKIHFMEKNLCSCFRFPD